MDNFSGLILVGPGVDVIAIADKAREKARNNESQRPLGTLAWRKGSPDTGFAQVLEKLAAKRSRNGQTGM